MRSIRAPYQVIVAAHEAARLGALVPCLDLRGACVAINVIQALQRVPSRCRKFFFSKHLRHIRHVSAVDRLTQLFCAAREG